MADNEFDFNAPAAPSLTLDAAPAAPSLTLDDAPAAPTLTLDPEGDAKVVEEAKN